jgi:hypothetical protein
MRRGDEGSGGGNGMWSRARDAPLALMAPAFDGPATLALGGAEAVRGGAKEA